MKWTDDQEQVLACNSDNLLVSASAGSGKTMTVIEKIARLIEDEHVDITNLLVITFTESASAEMKIRLKDTLSKSAKDNKFVATQLAKLPLGDISTIHAFCAKMLRKFFFLANIKPNFAVLDDNSSNFLKSKALDKTIKQYAESGDKEFVLLSSSFGGGRKFEGLKSSVLSLQDFLTGIVDKEKYLSDIALSCYKKEDNKALAFLNDYVLRNVRFLERRIKEKLLQAQKENATYFVEFLQAAQVQLGEICVAKDFWTMIASLHEMSLPRLTNKKLSDEEAQFKENFKPFWTDVQDRLKSIKQYVPQRTHDEAMNEFEKTSQLVGKLIEVEQVFEKHYEAQKNKRNGLDFADLERKFLEICKLDEVQNTLTFSHVFVDEYQDINYVQEEIISRLIKHAKLVMVGDVKQSIYAFRNSTPEIFSYKSADYKANEKHGSLKLLNDNFRSDSTILQFSNEIFSKCMTLDFGGIDYKECGMFRGLAKYEHVSPMPVVEVNLINTDKDENDKETPELPEVYSVSGDKMLYEQEISETKCEGLLIAQRILDMLKNGYEIYDAKEQKSKKITFGDIAVLCRNNETLKQISKVLTDLKVPTKINTKDNVYQNKDVAPLLSILKLAGNFHDDLSLATVLLSPFGNLTETELASIRIACPDEKYFYQAVKKFLLTYGQNLDIKRGDFDENTREDLTQLDKKSSDILVQNNVNNKGIIISENCKQIDQKNNKIDDKSGKNNIKNGQKIAEKLQKFWDFLNIIREKLIYNSLHEVLNFACDSVGYFDYLTSLPDGFAREKIVRDFVESFEGSDYNFDLAGFLDFVKNYAFEGRFASMLATSDNGVTLSTIHASKGLEYPIVFVAGCGNNFPTKTFREAILKDKTFGLGMQTFDEISFSKSTNLARNCILLSKRRSERCEELRLLYVALTRAKNHLIVIGENKDLFVAENDDAEGASNYLNWILSYLKPAERAALLLGKKEIVKKISGGDVKLQVYALDDFCFDDTKSRQIVFPKDDKKLTETIRKNMLLEMPKPCNIALKNSVSSLLAEHSSDEESLNLSPKKLSIFESKNSKIDSGKLGTLYHKIMEKIDFESPLEREYFDKILSDINLSDEYKKKVNFEKISTCENNLKKLGKLIIARELPFISFLPYNQLFGEGTDKKILVQGVADMLLSDGNKTFLVDYKTTKASRPEQLVEKYKVQLMLYKICLEHALNQKIDGAYIYSFSLDRLIKVL